MMKNGPAFSGAFSIYGRRPNPVYLYTVDHFIFNGRSFPAGTAVAGPSSRGIRYGDGVFETMKCLDGRLILVDEHFARIWKGMETLQFEIPSHFTPDRLKDEMIKLAEKNGHQKTARIRLTIFRGEGGLYDPVNLLPNYLIETWPLPIENQGGNANSINSNGLVLGIYDQVKKSRDILSNLKHNNFLPYVMAAFYAKEQKCNDAIILNSEGRVCDTTIANIFIIKGGQIYTPALSEGCVAGITRKVLIQAMQNAVYPVIEKELPLSELLEADELFLTNSIHGIRWVQRIADKEYDSKITREIYSSFNSTIC